MTDPSQSPTPDPHPESSSVKKELLDEQNLWDLGSELPESESIEVKPISRVPSTARGNVRIINNEQDNEPQLGVTRRPGGTVKVVGSPKSTEFAQQPFVARTTQEADAIGANETLSATPLASTDPFADPPQTAPSPVPQEPKPEPTPEPTPEPVQEVVASPEIIPVEPEPAPEPAALPLDPLSEGPAKLPFTPRDKVAVGIVLSSVAAIVLMCLVSLSAVLPFTPYSRAEPDYPIEGERIKIASTETYWTEPRRTGTNFDTSNPEVGYIPVAEIRLTSDSMSGAARILVRDDEGAILGDPSTFQLEPGATITFRGTDGFLDSGEVAAYQAEEIGTHYLVILEAPSADAPTSSFQEIAAIPFSSDRITSTYE